MNILLYMSIAYLLLSPEFKDNNKEYEDIHIHEYTIISDGNALYLNELYEFNFKRNISICKIDKNKYISLGYDDHIGNYKLDNIKINISESEMRISDWSNCILSENYEQKKYYMDFNKNNVDQMPGVSKYLLLHGSRVGIFVILIMGNDDLAIFSSSNLSEDQLEFFNSILKEEYNDKELRPVSE